MDHFSASHRDQGKGGHVFVFFNSQKPSTSDLYMCVEQQYAFGIFTKVEALLAIVTAKHMLQWCIYRTVFLWSEVCTCMTKIFFTTSITFLEHIYHLMCVAISAKSDVRLLQ